MPAIAVPRYNPRDIIIPSPPRIMNGDKISPRGWSTSTRAVPAPSAAPAATSAAVCRCKRTREYEISVAPKYQSAA